MTVVLKIDLKLIILDCSFEVMNEIEKKNETVSEENSISTQMKTQQIKKSATSQLQTPWEFWHYQRPERQFPNSNAQTSKVEQPVHLSYRDQLKALGKIKTVEHFFHFYVYMKKPTDMPREIDLFFFRSGEVPMWEVSENWQQTFLGISNGRHLDC